MFKFSKRSYDRMGGVDPKLIQIAERAIQITRIDFGIPEHGGVRSVETQQKLYADGLSNCDGLLKKSFHQPAEDGLGKAVDVFAYVDGKASWYEDHLTHIAAAFMQASCELGYKIEWGGFWSWKDLPHFQLVE